jgi:hypothetical protein
MRSSWPAARRWRAQVRDNGLVGRLSLITAVMALAVVLLGLGWALARSDGDDRPDLGPSIVVPAAGGATAVPDAREGRRARQRREREDRDRDRGRGDAQQGSGNGATSGSGSGSRDGGSGWGSSSGPGSGSAPPVSPPAALPAGDDHDDGADDDAGEAEEDGDD